MVASERGEAKIFVHWRASWFDEPMQICSAAERASMLGLLDTADVAKLGSAEALSFDQLFVDLLTKHHRGAVAMADSELRHGSDPRLRIMAHAIRHEQQGKIALMRGVDGPSAVTNAETCSPTTSIPNDMERFNGTPVERIISRINGSAPRGGCDAGRPG
jgi:hypothetical protein